MMPISVDEDEKLLAIADQLWKRGDELSINASKTITRLAEAIDRLQWHLEEAKKVQTELCRDLDRLEFP